MILTPFLFRTAAMCKNSRLDEVFWKSWSSCWRWTYSVEQPPSPWGATQPSPPPANGLRHSGHQNTGTKTARLGPQRRPTDSDVAMCGNQNIFMG